MTTQKQGLGSRTSLTTSALNSLANVTYVVAGTITHVSGGKTPLDCLVEVLITAPSSVSGNKRAKVFAQISLDGSVFTSGPTSGTTTTDEPDLIPLGTVPLNTVSVAHTAVFSLAAMLGGPLPYATKIIVFNDCGTAFPASTHSVYTADVTGDSA